MKANTLLRKDFITLSQGLVLKSGSEIIMHLYHWPSTRLRAA